MTQDDPSPLSHLDDRGRPSMVDVGAKPETARRARARARVRVSDEADRALREDRLPKGGVRDVVRLAAIGGAKQTSLLVPLCHPLRISGVEVELIAEGEGCWAVEAVVRAHDRTGVEMEAMTAACVGALTLYDMVKAVDRSARIEQVELLEKSGGKSGEWSRSGSDP